MTLHLPWLELAIMVPLLGALWVSRVRDAEWAQRRSIIVLTATFLCTIGAWIDFAYQNVDTAHDRWSVLTRLFGDDVVVLDELSAPLLSLAALQYLMTAVVTLRTKVRRFSFGWTLVSLSLLMATFSCHNPWALVLLLSASTVPPYVELRARNKPVGTYVSHMAVFVILLIVGWTWIAIEGPEADHSAGGIGLLMAAVLIRSGIVPMHCWLTDLFENATFGTALLYVTPMVGAYAAVRLVLPVTPDGDLRSIAPLLSLVTAVYASGMALVQQESRRFFCYLFLSHSSLVLVGLESATPVALTGALSVWLSVGLALTGFGLVIRSLESRLGRLSLQDFHGLYEQMPTLAVLFLLTGLASVGFPGTFGFIGTELLMDGAVHLNPTIGVGMVLAAALNGIAVLFAYFRLFTGARHPGQVPMQIRPRERLAVLTLATLILGGGIFPQPGISSRYEAAMHILNSRRRLNLQQPAVDSPQGPASHEPSTALVPLPTSRAPSLD